MSIKLPSFRCDRSMPVISYVAPVLQGRKRILLYTERAHFYFRYRIGGVKASFQASMSVRVCTVAQRPAVRLDVGTWFRKL